MFRTIFVGILLTSTLLQAQETKPIDLDKTLLRLSVACQNIRAKTEVPPDQKAQDYGFDPEILAAESKIVNQCLNDLVKTGIFVERYVVVPLPKEAFRDKESPEVKRFELIVNKLYELSQEIGQEHGLYSALEMCDLQQYRRLFGRYVPENGCPFKLRVPAKYQEEIKKIFKGLEFKKAPAKRGIIKIDPRK